MTSIASWLGVPSQKARALDRYWHGQDYIDPSQVGCLSEVVNVLCLQAMREHVQQPAGAGRATPAPCSPAAAQYVMHWYTCSSASRPHSKLTPNQTKQAGMAGLHQPGLSLLAKHISPAALPSHHTVHRLRAAASRTSTRASGCICRSCRHASLRRTVCCACLLPPCCQLAGWHSCCQLAARGTACIVGLCRTAQGMECSLCCCSHAEACFAHERLALSAACLGRTATRRCSTACCASTLWRWRPSSTVRPRLLFAAQPLMRLLPLLVHS